MSKLALSLTILTGCAAALVFILFSDEDATQAQGADSELSSIRSENNDSSLSSNSSIGESDSMAEDGVQPGLRQSSRSLSSQQENSFLSSVDEKDAFSVNSLPAEERFLTSSNQVNSERVLSILGSERYKEIVDSFEYEALENEYASELTEAYSDSLEFVLDGFDDLYVDSFACGVRSCIGQFGSLGNEFDWSALNQNLFAQNYDGPPVYTIIPSIIPDPANPAVNIYRFFISTDPESNEIIIPLSSP